jgi:hypothetical protein
VCAHPAFSTRAGLDLKQVFGRTANKVRFASDYAECLRMFTVGLTLRLPPILVPRALEAASAAFVRAPQRRVVNQVATSWLLAGTDCRVSV